MNFCRGVEQITKRGEATKNNYVHPSMSDVSLDTITAHKLMSVIQTPFLRITTAHIYVQITRKIIKTCASKETLIVLR